MKKTILTVLPGLALGFFLSLAALPLFPQNGYALGQGDRPGYGLCAGSDPDTGDQVIPWDPPPPPAEKKKK